MFALGLECGNTALQNMIYVALTAVGLYPAGIYMLKVNDRNTRTRCEICLKLTIRRQNDAEICSK